MLKGVLAICRQCMTVVDFNSIFLNNKRYSVQLFNLTYLKSFLSTAIDDHYIAKKIVLLQNHYFYIINFKRYLRYCHSQDHRLKMRILNQPAWHGFSTPPLNVDDGRYEARR